MRSQSSLFLTVALAFTGMFLGTGDATAQLVTHTSAMIETAASVNSAPARCGTFKMREFEYATAVRNTATSAPELYRQAVSESKGNTIRLMSADEATFWAPDHVTMQFVQIKAVRLHQGRFARVWVDVRDTGRTIVKSKLPILITALEDSTSPTSRNPGKGIIENDIEVFGPTPTTVGDGVQDFLFFDITDQTILGFFMPGDQTGEPFSNNRNLLYIDSREGMSQTSSVLNTLAHEFQHLIHHGFNPEADPLINEGCSEVAGQMCGYVDRANSNYLRNTNSKMFDFPDDRDGSLQAYERAFTLMHYLYEQFGESFMREIPKTRAWGMSAIDQALKASHPDNPRASWDSVGREFAVANWMQNSIDPRYAYRVNITSPTQRRARHLRTYTQGTIRSNDTVTVLPFGAAYFVYEAPPALGLTFKGRYKYRVVAIGYRGDEVDVINIEPGSTAVVGSPGSVTSYDRVVIVISELSNATQKITWSVTDGISGVADDAVSESNSSVLAVSPNPMSDRGAIRFKTDGDGVVDLAIFAPNGEMVRQIIDGERLERGEHSVTIDVTSLPEGAYLARIREGSRSATQLIVVR